eukprot:TRINITY_DN2897_c0_g2_i2.p1 TRINITY_DN2897_c0_g2~~TRINITY_DN2897_c0_g2_i2.p1  ORF type:complete len:425 (-),score=107.29 TRINITY_DN2897_c0_g2_i2:147-1421(-)
MNINLFAKNSKKKDFNPSVPQVPLLIARCVGWIAGNALDVEGIFRVSGSHASVQEIRKNFAEKGGADVDLTPFGPHVVSSTVMQWLCELEIPLITFDCYNPLIKAQALEDEDLRQSEIVHGLKALPPGNKAVLNMLLDLWHQVHLNSEKNKMPSSSLAIILGPTLLRDKDLSKQSPEQLAKNQREIKNAIKLVDILIQNYPSYKKALEETDVPATARKSPSPAPKLSLIFKEPSSGSIDKGPTSPSRLKQLFEKKPKDKENKENKENKEKPSKTDKKWEDPDRIIKPEDHECITSLRHILDDKVAREAFMTYLREKEMSDENLLFFESVDKYKGLILESERCSFLRQLMKEYIGEDSTYQINIDSDCRREIEEALEKAENEAIELPKTLLDEAQHFIFRLIEEHSYPRFLQSPHCRALMKTKHK